VLRHSEVVDYCDDDATLRARSARSTADCGAGS